jgi:hypothetical protein
MTARHLAIAAFAVLGVWYLGGAAAGVLGAVAGILAAVGSSGFDAAVASSGFDGIGSLLLGYLPSVVLGGGFLMLRAWLAGRIAGGEEQAAGDGTGAAQLQLVGITLIGVYLAAYGLESFLDGTLQTFVASEHDEYFQKTTWLRRNAGAIATTFVGFVVLTTSRQVHGWLVREHAR